MKRSKIQTIDTCDFGHVECPIQVDGVKGSLETYLVYGIKDLVSLVDHAAWYYAIKPDRSQRQAEISDLFNKLSRLLSKEKSVCGRIWSPIIIGKPDK